MNIEIQNAADGEPVPDERLLRTWAEAAVRGRQDPLELLIRLVGEPEIIALNRDYRGQDRPTNVLSFPFEAPAPVSSDLIGDLVICAPVVAREALDQGKAAHAHWAHMVVHGVLHLLGYDHISEAEAKEMEDLERGVLRDLGYPDPYESV